MGALAIEYAAVLDLGGQRLRGHESFELRLDDYSPRAIEDVVDRDLYLLLGRARRPQSREADGEEESTHPHYHAGEYECLMLLPQENTKHHYRRIGYIVFGLVGFPGYSIYSQQHRAYWMLRACHLADTCFRSHDIPEHLYEEVTDDFMYTITLV